ncbi:MAG TPA: MBL fold metallo-hydrolase [Desulfobacteraceae bacterium]|nr:MBL fold metallo-hydrolase [Desulfobacteraceae bacterium]
MRFGDYECSSILLDRFRGDGGAMFGVVPKILWSSKFPADSSNRISMTLNSLLIHGKGRNILVDTGYGNKLSEKEKKIYGIERGIIDFDKKLSKFGLTSNDITDVFITHLHSDHTGGATSLKGGKVVPTFPNAVYYIQKDQWEAAKNPNVRDKSGYCQDDFLPLETLKVLRLVNGPEKLFPGIDVFVTNGHTPGQQHLLIKGDTESLFFCADLFPTSAHLPVPWNMGYDLYPVTIMEEKEKFLKEAVKKNWIFFFEHDPEITGAYLKESKGKIVINTRINL